VQNTRTRGILAGTNSDVMRLERLPPDSGLTVGQRVVTSGDGGQLPVGVPVGVITRVGKDGVDVKPLGDIQSMNYVQVIDTGIDNLLLSADVAGP
jgi:rod shape-determining protein MreC